MFALAKFGMILYKTAVAVIASVWNPSDKAAAAVLSNGNATLNSSGAQGTPAMARGTASQASGKWYFEVTIGSTFANNGAGVSKSGGSLTGSSGVFDSNEWGLQIITNGKWYLATNGAAGSSTGISAVPNDVINVALDITGGKLYLGVNGSYRKSDGTSGGDPAAGSNPTYSSLSGTFYPIGASNSNTSNIQINTAPASPPSGYTKWG